MSREQILDKWLSECLKDKAYHRVPLAGDASFRRYHRVFVAGEQYVIMDAPPPESIQHFVHIASILQEQGLRVPLILNQDLENGFLRLQDFGDKLYLSELSDQTADALYQDAFNALLKMQGIEKSKTSHAHFSIPDFDEALIKRQFGFFEEWYLKKHLNMPVTEAIQQELYPIYELLLQIIQAQPKVFVHLDYHSRNLMLLETGSPGILDFQDAMMGPITYDLVSLLQDCYIDWPRARIECWVQDYQSQAARNGLMPMTISNSDFIKWFDWTGLQRHIKNLGIFSRLHYRDGKSQYLKDIPRVINYIRETCYRYDELKTLQQFFEIIAHRGSVLCAP